MDITGQPSLSLGGTLEPEPDASEAGCDDYLRKPIDGSELPRLLAKYLAVREDAPQPTMDGVTTETDASDQLATMPRPSEAPWSDSTPADDVSAVVRWDLLIEKMGDEECFGEIVVAYLRGTHEHIEKLTQALASGEGPEIGAHAHALKNIGGNLFADGLAEIAAHVEQAGRENDIEAATQHLHGLKAEVEKVVTALSQRDGIEKAKTA